MKQPRGLMFSSRYSLSVSSWRRLGSLCFFWISCIRGCISCIARVDWSWRRVKGMVATRRMTVNSMIAMPNWPPTALVRRSSELMRGLMNIVSQATPGPRATKEPTMNRRVPIMSVVPRLGRGVVHQRAAPEPVVGLEGPALLAAVHVHGVEPAVYAADEQGAVQ